MIKVETKQAGFTLIEMVVVIVLLGILAVTAVPKFLNLSKDANEGSLEGLAAAVKDEVSLIHAEAIIQGEAGSEVHEVKIGGRKGFVACGYPWGRDGMELLAKNIEGLENWSVEQKGADYIEFYSDTNPKRRVVYTPLTAEQYVVQCRAVPKVDIVDCDP
ncbi:pilus assembly FimT family protein [Veronia pacifica]|uniref:MSHA biogenesis protein MshA n=1 Tax=Veronia pacifica TaxID=1080227 RepID=A0A1C3EF16_9GAMM|nr:type II secretion system protein [Veronia pacifica]ODA31836.1 hypothetical protein A8L45_15200 [Veronia pacifica]